MTTPNVPLRAELTFELPAPAERGLGGHRHG